MIKTKHILTTEQTPDRLYIPPTIEVVEVEEECVLQGGSVKTDIDDSYKGTGDGDFTPTAKGNNLFFFDNFSEDTNDDNSDY